MYPEYILFIWHSDAIFIGIQILHHTYSETCGIMIDFDVYLRSSCITITIHREIIIELAFSHEYVTLHLRRGVQGLHWMCVILIMMMRGLTNNAYCYYFVTINQVQTLAFIME